MPVVAVLELGHKAEVDRTLEPIFLLRRGYAEGDGEYLIRIHGSYVILIRREDHPIRGGNNGDCIEGILSGIGHIEVEG
jgi:hypothetical protein